MIQNCLDSDSLFGVVLIKSGVEVGGSAEPYSVGTVANITQVNRLDDGRMILNITGQIPFHIVDLDKTKPYFMAQIKTLGEENSDTITSDELQKICGAIKKHLRLIIVAKGGWVEEPKLPNDPVSLSYLIAPALQIDLPQKQELLEERNTLERLKKELQIIEQEAEPLRQIVDRYFGSKFSRQ